uniref:Putative secreted protein n=1 Tax=Anopheles triannulatus TaxID=58253 RepID=A0A2M4B5L3_9DIPT
MPSLVPFLVSELAPFAALSTLPGRSAGPCSLAAAVGTSVRVPSGFILTWKNISLMSPTTTMRCSLNRCRTIGKDDSWSGPASRHLFKLTPLTSAALRRIPYVPSRAYLDSPPEILIDTSPEVLWLLFLPW